MVRYEENRDTLSEVGGTAYDGRRKSIQTRYLLTSGRSWRTLGAIEFT